MTRKKQTASDLRKQAAELASMPLSVAHEDEASSDEPKAATATTKDSIDYTFQFEHKDRRGQFWRGTFTNRILNVGEQQAVASICARLTGGVPFEALDPVAQTLNEAIAHLSVSLTDKEGEWQCPTWAQDLRQLHDQGIIVALWQEVVAHERHFFRLDEAPEDGAKAS